MIGDFTTHRRRMKSVIASYDQRLMRNALKCLYIRYAEGKSPSKQRARKLSLCATQFRAKWRLRNSWKYWLEGRRGDYLYRCLLLKRSLKALKEVPYLFLSSCILENRFLLLPTKIVVVFKGQVPTSLIAT